MLAHHAIGDTVEAGECLFNVAGDRVHAAITGVLRGCIRPGIPVSRGMKIGDIDPRNDVSFCGTISEKARALGGSVLETLCGSIFAPAARRACLSSSKAFDPPLQAVS